MKNDIPEKTGNYAPADLIKPPVYDPADNYHVFKAGMNYRFAAKKIDSWRGIIVEDSYSTAIAFYSWLKKQINREHPVTDYFTSRNTKNIINKKTNKILVRVRNYRLDLKKAPLIPWLREFYPGKTEFLISLPDILGMNGSWQWYKKGIRYPVLEQSIHPFYGVYFPNRTTHLTMFDHWLQQNKERFSTATDIGTGCGILSFILAKHGIGNIHATDINPNAVYSTSAEADRFGLYRSMRVEQASLFGSQNKVPGLAVFNPPWIPGKCMGILDRGVYYEKGFFENFFYQANKIMSPGSTLVIIFSSFAIEAGITGHNPVEKAICNNKAWIPEEKLTRQAAEKAVNPSGNWISKVRAKEKIELWIINKA